MKEFTYTEEQRDAIAATLPEHVDGAKFIDDLQTTADIHLLISHMEASGASKSQLQRISGLSSDLAKVLSAVDPCDIGMGTETYHNEDGVQKYDRYFERAEQERAHLISKLNAIEEYAKTQLIFEATVPNAAQPRRKHLLEILLQRWVNWGGALGGPNSKMVQFLQAVSKPVLGNRALTDGALVALAYSWRDAMEAERQALRVGMSPEELEKVQALLKNGREKPSRN